MASIENERFDVIKLFDVNQCLHVCAPMVRYSKLPFRMLVRKYNCHLAFSPMIVCKSFIDSVEARHSDFITSSEDRPLIIQFASNDGIELANAAEFVHGYSDGVDINCGCPQRWAISDGYGACLLEKPEVVQDMIRQVRNRLPSPYTISVKIRIHRDIRKTVEFCRRAEKAGSSFITVHGRTKEQRSIVPVNARAIKTIKQSLQIPVIGNGDIYHVKDSINLQEFTGVNGVMAARGLLQNPTLFSGTENTTMQSIDEWNQLVATYGASFQNFHQHLIFMLEKLMSGSEKKLFNSYTSYTAVYDHLEQFKTRF